VRESVVIGNLSAAADQEMSQQVSSVSAEETDGVPSASLIVVHQNGVRDERETTTAAVQGFVCQEGPVDNSGACSPTGDSGNDCVGSPGGPQGRCEPSPSNATSPASVSVTFRDLHPTPKINRTVKTGDGRRQAAAVLTSPSYRKALFDKTSTSAKSPKCAKIQKKKKKLTCRQDKKRGRKPQGDKRKTKQPRSTSTPSSANNKGEEDMCVNCGYMYGDYDDPLIDDPWFQCGKCGRWGHESCGNVAQHGLFFCVKCE